MPQPPLRLGSTSSPSRQLSKSEKIGRSGNEGNKCWHSGKKKSYFVVQKIFVSDTVCYYQLHFSEIDLPSPDENEVRW